MTKKKIKSIDSPNSINTIGQKGDNQTTSTLNQGNSVKSKESFWIRTRWYRWSVILILAVLAIAIPAIYQSEESMTNNNKIDVKQSPGSINTIGQKGNNQINIGSQQRDLTANFIDSLSAVLPADKQQKIELNSIEGDAEAFRFANKIKEYLESHGYIVEGISKRTYSKDWTDASIFTRPDGTVKEIIVGRQP